MPRLGLMGPLDEALPVRHGGSAGRAPGGAGCAGRAVGATEVPPGQGHQLVNPRGGRGGRGKLHQKTQQKRGNGGWNHEIVGEKASKMMKRHGFLSRKGGCSHSKWEVSFKTLELR